MSEEGETTGWGRLLKWGAWALAGVLVLVSLGMMFVPGWMPYRYYQTPEGHDAMEPTIPGGTRVVVSQWGIDGEAIQRGDEVMFRYVEGSEMYDVIGRVVAMPGESVAYGPSELRVSGVNVRRHGTDNTSKSGHVVHFEKVGEATYEVTQPVANSPMQTVELEKSEYLVLPNNRTVKAFHGAYGPVRLEQIIGKVVWTSAPPTIVGKPNAWQ